MFSAKLTKNPSRSQKANPCGVEITQFNGDVKQNYQTLRNCGVLNGSSPLGSTKHDVRKGGGLGRLLKFNSNRGRGNSSSSPSLPRPVFSSDFRLQTSGFSEPLFVRLNGFSIRRVK